MKQKYHALGIPTKGNKRKADAALQELLRQYESEEIKIDRAKADTNKTLKHFIKYFVYSIPTS